MCCLQRTKVSKKTVNVIESGIFVIAIIIIVCLFTLPVIFHYTQLDRSEVTSAASNSLSTINSSQAVNCSLSWGEQSSNATNCIKYIGTICKPILAQLHVCIIGEGETINVNVTQLLQNQHETTISQLNTFLNNHKKCHKVALPFLCQFYYPLSDCSAGKSYTASRDDCILISTGVCGQLWKSAIDYGFGFLLPDCDNLPLSFRMNESSAGHRVVDRNENDTNGTEDVPCRDDFIKTNSICEPRCDQFEQGSHTDTMIMIYSEVIASVIGFVLSIVVIVMSIRDYKTMLVYPSILVVFQVIDTAILSSLVIITAFDRVALYCSSVSLLATLNKPSSFCTFSGALFHYSVMNMLFWWFSNLVIFFHKVMLPFQANRLEKLKRNKYIFLTIVIICIFLPLPAVIICLSVEEYKYNIHRFPTTLCISNGDMWFYSTTLPIDFFLVIGICMLVIILWNLRKESNIFRKKSRIKLSTPEKKIILVFTSFVVFGVFILAHVSDITAKSAKFTSAITKYFQCEAFGYVPGKCDRSTFDKIYSPYMSAVSYLLLSLVPLSILNFVLKWESVKKAGLAVKKLASKYTKHTNESSKESSKETSLGNITSNQTVNQLFTQESRQSMINQFSN